MDEVTLSRMETEWLAACFYGSSQRMPTDVRKRLQFLGLIDDRGELTAAGKQWIGEQKGRSGVGRSPSA
jgi:hypothetical protein